MKNLKIAKKFLVTFSIIIVLSLASVAIGIISLINVGENFTSFYEQPFKVTNTTMDMRRAIQAAVKNVGYATMTDDVTQTEKYIDDCKTELTTLKDGIEFLYANFSGDKVLIDNFKATMDSGVAAKDKVFENARKNNNQVAIDVFFNEYQPILVKAGQELEEINAVSMNRADTLYSASNKSRTTAFILLLSFSVVGLCSSVLLAVYLTKSMTKPISEIEKAAEKLSKGDLDATILYSSKDELGLLAGSFRIMSDNLKDIISDINHLLGEMGDGNFQIHTQIEEKYVGKYRDILLAMRGINSNLSNTLLQINQASDQVSVGSDQVSSGAQALAQGATEQASSVEELSATIAGISAQIKQNAGNA